MRKPAVNAPLCALQVGLTHYVMPMDAGLKVMAALGKGMQCAEGYERGDYTYTPDSSCREVSIRAIKPSQLRMPRNAPERPPLGLPHELPKLPR